MGGLGERGYLWLQLEQWEGDKGLETAPTPASGMEGPQLQQLGGRRWEWGNVQSLWGIHGD